MSLLSLHHDLALLLQLLFHLFFLPLQILDDLAEIVVNHLSLLLLSGFHVFNLFINGLIVHLAKFHFTFNAVFEAGDVLLRLLDPPVASDSGVDLRTIV